jgi:hypothetical protein
MSAMPLTLFQRGLVLAVALVVAGCANWPWTYSGRAGSATVVDAATGQPLPGVVVVASWNLIDIRDGTFAGVLFTVEAVTDTQGEFILPSWGPRQITMGNSGRVPRALDYSEPHFHLFKSGFRYRVVAGPNRALERLRGLHWIGDPMRDSWWDKLTIRLERSTDTPREYANMLYTSMLPLEECNWVRVPHMAAAYVKEARRLQGIVDSVPRQSPDRLLHESCSDAARPLAAYLD